MIEPEHGHAPLVLIVDDDDALRAMLLVALRRAGLDAIEASNGRDALDLIDSQAIGVVVCDLGMPGMSGFDVVRALRERRESATLPFILMTGSGDGDSVLDALQAGADDFLAKPIRIEELIARVKAHVRTGSAWREIVVAEFRMRADALQAIGRLSLSAEPEEAAATVVAELARRTGARYVGILQQASGSRLRPLATYSTRDGLQRGGPDIGPARTQELLQQARLGPWSVDVGQPNPGEAATAYWDAGLDLAAGAPILAGDDLVGILTVGVGLEEGQARIPGRRATLLASVIDYASVLSIVAGPAIADRRQIEEELARLRLILSDRAFVPVYQPIVALDSQELIGYEALTRFGDGAPPSLRFSEARAAGLGEDYELAAIEAAIEGATAMPEGPFLSLNISPDLVVTAQASLARLLATSKRRIVLEVTEHAPIADYEGFRRAVGQLGDVRLSVDDAGAGYASLRHILELGPAFVKLDMSLVQGIDGDPLRQALAAGLAYFAARGGCQIIAEGVEREAEARALNELGVEFAQGYLFGRPGPFIA